MFDVQIREIFKLIDKQLQHLEDRQPSEEVVSNFSLLFTRRFAVSSRLTLQQQSHFVISGGLGSSRYVQEKIKERYEYDQHGKRIQILVSTDP